MADIDMGQFPTFFGQPRYCALPFKENEAHSQLNWRMDKKMKTPSVGLVMCLNIGVDPPDVIKTVPCARLECWIDPFKSPAQRALESIGKQLQSQYEGWQPRAKYRQSLDPSLEDIKKLCGQLRRSAKDERALFHYNGHGVPRPTAGGELWVFNKDYTQYIPVNMATIREWLGAPAVYVLDCCGAGAVLKTFLPSRTGLNTPPGATRAGGGGFAIPGVGVGGGAMGGDDEIVLCACSEGQTLPTAPELPADLFTACLTTPLKLALRWACMKCDLISLAPDDVDKLPGKLGERKTPLGELNWVFTAVTDTIAWNSLPRDMFQRLFRQDLLLAALMRNFLLAQRIMHSCNCTPMSYPALPPTHHHPLWSTWDHAAELCLCQLQLHLHNSVPHPFTPTPFFEQQLTAFEVWLDVGHRYKQVPEQLPVVLQVLLSQTHRLRALQLLGRFLDMGSEAVLLSLSVQIFPYVLRLLQSPAHELKLVLVFIWGKILAVDPSCQVDLVRDKGYLYFARFLQLPDVPDHQKATALFVLATVCARYPPGQLKCGPCGDDETGLTDLCTTLLVSVSGLVRQWAALCLGKLCEDNFDNKAVFLDLEVHPQLMALLRDPLPEVRAAATHSLGVFVGALSPGDDGAGGEGEGLLEDGMPTPEQRKLIADFEIGRALLSLYGDGSPLVRREIAVCFGLLVFHRRRVFLRVIPQHGEAPRPVPQGGNTSPSRVRPAVSASSPSPSALPPPALALDAADMISDELVTMLWKMGLRLSDDPCQQVKECAVQVTMDFLALCRQADRGAVQPQSVHGRQRSHGSVALQRQPSPSLSPSPPPMGVFNIRPSSSQKDLKSMGLQSTPRAEPHDGHVRSQFSSMHDMPPAPVVMTKLLSPYFSWAASTLRSHPSQRAGAVGGVLRASRASASVSLPPQGDGSAARREGEGTQGENEGDLSALEPKRTRSYSLHLGPAPIGDRARQQLDDLAWYEQRQQEQEEQHVAEYRHPGAVASDSTSPAMQQRLWRQHRNLQTRAHAQTTLANVVKTKFDERICFENESRMSSCLCLHPYDSLLIVADESEHLTVWNYVTGEQLRRFPNGNPHGSRITALEFVNMHDNPLLLVGASDGSVRVWKDYDTFPPAQVTLVTTWRVVPIPPPSDRTSPLSLTWQQLHGHVVASSPRTSLYVWDTTSELCLREIKPDSGITSLASESSSKCLVVAGCADGAVRLYDVRSPTPQCMVACLTGHRAWVMATGAQQGGDGAVVSGSDDGIVRFWDLRQHATLRMVKTHKPHLFALSLHDYAPVFVSGSSNQTIKVFSHEGKALSVIRHHYGFLGRRIAPVSCLRFHAFNMTFAAGFTDSIVSVYSAEQANSQVVL